MHVLEGAALGDDPDPDETPTGSAAVPVVAASETGAVAVTYHDFRDNTLDPATLPSAPPDQGEAGCRPAAP
ncbi:hypothetical protein [Nonomuraea sp. PA05]|uniref:hypothetical protein n=1 Tax=Nonomuraea sp. PA05 TaxID=2604466 RepID=UPI001651B766|nr:hypothetical protein [Nonomuraea sp. PA05]